MQKKQKMRQKKHFLAWTPLSSWENKTCVLERGKMLDKEGIWIGSSPVMTWKLWKQNSVFNLTFAYITGSLKYKCPRVTFPMNIAVFLHLGQAAKHLDDIVLCV